MFFITLALIANVLVTGFYGTFLLFLPKSEMVTEVYGSESIATKIVGGFYYAVSIVSLYCLTDINGSMEIISTLILMQILYKVISVGATRKFTNPVVISNSIIAILYTALYIVYFL